METQKGKKTKDVLFSEVGDWGENGESEKVAKYTENELVDSNIQGYFGNYMIPAVEELNQSHRRMSLPRLSAAYCRRRHISLTLSLKLRSRPEKSKKMMNY